MTTLREAAQQALEALKSCSGVPHWPALQPTIDALRAALAQQDEPQTIDEAMQQPRAMAQAYEAGYKAGVAAEREACAKVCEQYELARSAAAAIRARGNT